MVPLWLHGLRVSSEALSDATQGLGVMLLKQNRLRIIYYKSDNETVCNTVCINLFKSFSP